MAKEGKYAQVRLPSGEVRMVLLSCKATIGQVEMLIMKTFQSEKQGEKRHMGFRPAVEVLL